MVVWALLGLVASILPAAAQNNDVDFWNVERPPDMANIKQLEVKGNALLVSVLYRTSGDVRQDTHGGPDQLRPPFQRDHL